MYFSIQSYPLRGFIQACHARKVGKHETFTLVRKKAFSA
jgi:hypothetical protein